MISESLKTTPRLQIKLQSHQLKAYQLLNHTNFEVKEILFGGAKGGGKSFLGCTWILSQALLFPETFYFVARAELNDLRKYTLPSFIEAVQKLGLKREYVSFNGQDNYISLPNKSKIYFISCKHLPGDPLFERFGSLQFTSGWLEEAGEIEHIEAYENLKKTVGRWKNLEYNLPGKLLITCNPKKNWLYHEFYTPYRQNNLPIDKAFIIALPTDNIFLAKSYIQTLETGTKRDIQRLRYGIWDYDDSDNALISFQNINNIFTNSFIQPTNDKFLSCDIAFSNDNFVVIAWSGFVIDKIYVFGKIDPKELCEKILEIAKETKTPHSNVVYDADGLGSYLRGYLPGAVGINNNHRPSTPEYQNLKTEMYFLLADFMNQNKLYCPANISPDLKQRIIDECQMIKRDSEVGEKLAIVSKAKVKELLGHSPDITDALAYRFIFWIMWNK